MSLLKEYSNHLMSLHEETLYFFLMTEKVAFVSAFYELLLLKTLKKKKKRTGAGEIFTGFFFLKF